MFQFDSVAGGLTVRMAGAGLTGALLSAFGADLWSGFGTALEGGDLSVLPAAGSNFATLGDIGLALAFSLSGRAATVVVNHDTQPPPPGVPEPASAALALRGLAAAARMRRGRVRLSA